MTLADRPVGYYTDFRGVKRPIKSRHYGKIFKIDNTEVSPNLQKYHDDLMPVIEFVRKLKTKLSIIVHYFLPLEEQQEYQDLLERADGYGELSEVARAAYELLNSKVMQIYEQRQEEIHDGSLIGQQVIIPKGTIALVKLKHTESENGQNLINELGKSSEDLSGIQIVGGITTIQEDTQGQLRKSDDRMSSVRVDNTTYEIDTKDLI